MIRDLRFAARQLAKTPTFTLVAVLTLALGLGATCAIFSVVNAVLLRPLPFRQPDRLVQVWEMRLAQGQQTRVSPADFADWREQNRVFDGIAAYLGAELGVRHAGDPELVRGALVSPALPDLLGVTPLLGRTFAAGEDRAGGGGVVLIGESYWRRAFAADPGAVGRTLRVDGQPYTVIGVMPRELQFPDQAEIWLPLALDAAGWSQRGGRYLEVVARLRDGVTPERAETEMKALAARLAAQYPQTNQGIGVGLVPLREALVGDVRPALLMLSGAVAFVLLVACANVASLLLARVTGRQREIAVRVALGASRGQLVRQLLTEYGLLGLLGGAAGLALAAGGIRLLLLLEPAGLARIQEVPVDAGVLGFGLLLALVTGVSCGLLPALQASRQSPGAVLKEGGGKATSGIGSRQIQSLFVVGQFALALVLLVGAGLMGRSFQTLLAVDPGFAPEEVLTLSLSLPERRYADPVQQAAFYRRTLERLGDVPGVEAVGAVSTLPMTDAGLAFTFEIEGRPAPAEGERLLAAYDVVSPEYFSLLRVPLLRGRGLTARDTAGAPAVCVINQAMARRFWPGEDPVGRRISIGDHGSNPREIVGIVGDIRQGGLDAEPLPAMYLSYEQTPWPAMALLVRSSAPAASLLPRLREAVWSVDQDLPVSRVQPMEQILAASLSQRRFDATLLGLFAAVGLALAATGVYGIMSYRVTERTREIGIRMALGAGAGEVRGLVLAQGLGLALAGVAVGLPLAFALTRLVAHLLFGVSAADPLTFAGVSLVLAVVAAVACYVPAARAVRVDPLVAIRHR